MCWAIKLKVSPKKILENIKIHSNKDTTLVVLLVCSPICLPIL